MKGRHQATNMKLKPSCTAFHQTKFDMYARTYKKGKLKIVQIENKMANRKSAHFEKRHGYSRSGGLPSETKIASPKRRKDN